MNWKPIRAVKYIAIHCAATRPDMNIGAEEIRRLHLMKGWLDIGYHYVIPRNGRIEKGRPDTQPGAHVRGFNEVSLGICLIGGCEMTGPKETPTWQDWYSKYAPKAKPENNFTPDQWLTLRILVDSLKREHPDAVVQGHRDFPNVAKACPSFDVKAKLIEWYGE